MNDVNESTQSLMGRVAFDRRGNKASLVVIKRTPCKKHWRSGPARAVLPNLCAAAHKCAARAVKVCRGRMSEIKSFQWEVSLKFSTVIENVQFPKFSHGTLLPLHHNMITQS